MQAQSYLAIFNVFLAVFLALAVLSLKTKGSIWLALTLFFYALHDILRLGTFIDNRLIMVYLPVIFLPTTYLICSTLYLYTNKVLFDDQKPKLYLHLIMPTIVFLIHVMLIILIPEKMTVTNIKSQAGIHRSYIIFLVISMPIYHQTVMWLTFYRIMEYKRQYKDNFSTEISNNIQWLVIFLLFNIGFSLAKTVVLVYCFIKKYGVPFTIVDEIVLIMILFIFIYYLITKPKILPIVLEDHTDKDQKYAKVNLSDKQRKQYANQLEKYMVNEQAFLDDNISIAQIADGLQIPRHLLSMTINIEYDQNFYSYINTHRIRFAEKLLTDPDAQDESVLIIAFNSGFQSKSSFNRAFKTFYCMTPTEYRKKHSA